MQKRRNAMVRRIIISSILAILLSHACLGNAVSLHDDVLTVLTTTSNLGFATRSFEQSRTSDIALGSDSNDFSHFNFDPSDDVDLKFSPKLQYAGELNTDKLILPLGSTENTSDLDYGVNKDADRPSGSELSDLTSLLNAGFHLSPRFNLAATDPGTPAEVVSSVYQTFGNKMTLDDQSKKQSNNDRLTFSIRGISNLPGVRGWALFLRVRY
jgi:hypothetical protein